MNVNEYLSNWAACYKKDLDIGPETEKIFAEVIKNSKTILWSARR